MMAAATMEEYLAGVEQDGFKLFVSDDGRYVAVSWHDAKRRRQDTIAQFKAGFGLCAEIPAGQDEWPDVVSRLVAYYYANRHEQ
jgi:hypothetical protein